MSRSTWLHRKSEAVGERGMVAANHPLAAEVGADVLQRGGNAVDAAVGTLLLSGALPHDPTRPEGPALLVVSGRVSFEIVQKAVAARLGAIAAVGAPTSLAIDVAERTGVLLAGFVRGGGLNLYTHATRLQQ